MFFICFVLIQSIAQAQTDTSQYILVNPVEDILDLPIKNNIGTEIFSASKQEESAFDAPLTSFVITQEDIKKNGITSIPEALRLVPGVIVRETSNGNYDVHIRGLGNIPPYGNLQNTMAAGVLLMIDNRPVYNHLNGGIFWETIPIGLQDIEQIEVVQGPTTSLYGSNAFTGVVNIITKRPKGEKIQVNSDSYVGNYQTFINNTSLNYQISNKLVFMASSNFQHRHRTDEEFFSFQEQTYVSFDSLKSITGDLGTSLDKNEIFGEPDLACNNFGFNTFLHFKPNAETSFILSAGLQKSKVNRIYLASLTPMLTFSSETQYTDLKFSWKNLNTQISFLSGFQDAKIILPFDFRTWDVYTDYSFMFLDDKLRITPSFFYRNTGYRDDKGNKTGLINATSFQIIRSIAGGLKIDYLFWQDKMRLVLGGRLESFNLPSNKPYLSYQAILNYKPSEKHIFWVLAGRSNVSPSITDYLLNVFLTTPLTNPTGFTLQTTFMSSEDANLPVQDLIEVGYRGYLLKNLLFDVNVFVSKTEGFTFFISRPPVIEPPIIKNAIRTENFDTYIEQLGFTISLDYTTKNFQFRPFITFQQSTWQNFSPFRTAPELDSVRNIENTFSLKDVNSPDIFGGFILNYQLGKRWNLNANAYFFGEHSIISEEVGELEEFNLENPNEQPGVKIKQQFLLNLNLRYKISNNLFVFGSAKNLFANDYQHYFTDRIRPSYIFGFNFEL